MPDTLTEPPPPREGTERLMPLDVILLAMRAFWRNNKDDKAVNCAKVAAPFVHARRAAARGRLDGELAALTDSEIADALRR